MPRNIPLDCRRARGICAIILAWAILQGVLLGVHPQSPIRGELIEPDSYMRIVRVEEFVHGSGWFDTAVERSNAPHGENLHWTRPFDVLIVAGAAPLMPLLGVDNAIFWSAALICPLLYLAIIFATIWAARPLMVSTPLLALAAFAQPYLIVQSLPGKADHHTLQILLLTLAIGFTLRALRPGYPRAAMLAGVVTAAGVWVSVEMLLAMILTMVVVTSAWLVTANDHYSKAALRYSLALAITLAIAHVVERPPSDYFLVEYDKFSVVHVATGVFLTLTWYQLTLIHGQLRHRHTTIADRTALLVGNAAIYAGILVILFPRILAGPDVDVDPAIGPIWLDKVLELKPLYPTSAARLGQLFLVAGQAVVAVAAVPIIFGRLRSDDSRLLWAAIALTLAVFFVLTLQHVRSAGFLAVPASIIVARLLGDLRGSLLVAARPQLGRLRWAGACAVVLGGFMLMGAAVAGTPDGPNGFEGDSQCPLVEIEDYLSAPSGYGAHVRVVAATIWYGPELLYRTPHSILAGPYHRNTDGAVDLYNLFILPPAESQTIVDRRGIDLILICPSEMEYLFAAEDAGPGSLDRLLRSGEGLPAWLHKVELPPGLAGRFLLFEVVR